MTEPRTPPTLKVRAELRRFVKVCETLTYPPSHIRVGTKTINALLDALEEEEKVTASQKALITGLRDAREDAERELRTARTDTLLLYWHADAHAEPDCKRCTEWFDVVLPAAMDAAGRARAALAQEGADVRAG